MNRGSWIAALMLTAACGGRKDEAMAKDTMMMATAPAKVEYTVVLKSRWTSGNFPLEYPAAGVVSGPHFSGLIGATHAAGYDIFTEGTMPTPGLERLSEEGKHAPLDDEIRSAISAGTAGALFETGALRDFADSLVTTFEISQTHPLVTLVTMVAPSPDWFTGVNGLALFQNGQWIDEVRVTVYGWDAGTDSGTTYSSPDKETSPRQPITRLAYPLSASGPAPAVGTFRFLKIE